MSRCLVIELLGPPGSGKSSLASALAALPGVVVVKEHGLGDAPALAVAAVRAGRMLVHPSPPAVRATRQAAWVTRVAATDLVVGRRSRGDTSTVVLDQGPVYTLGRLDHFRRSRRGELWWLRQVVRTADLLDLLVVLDADLPTLAERIQSRNKPHVARTLGPEDVVAYLYREQEICRTLADRLGRHGVPRLDLDTTREPPAQVSAVLGALRSPLCTRRSLT